MHEGQVLASELRTVRDEIERRWRSLADGDRLACCGFLRRSARRRWRGEQEFLAVAEHALAETAVDWDKLLALLQILATLLAPLVIKRGEPRGPGRE